MSPSKKDVSSSLVAAPVKFGISDALKVAVICVSRSILSSTITTVGFLSSGSILSFKAAKTIKSDFPDPWKCQINPFFGYPARTLSTMRFAPSYC